MDSDLYRWNSPLQERLELAYEHQSAYWERHIRRWVKRRWPSRNPELAPVDPKVVWGMLLLQAAGNVLVHATEYEEFRT